jgi:hypothetical protein
LQGRNTGVSKTRKCRFDTGDKVTDETLRIVLKDIHPPIWRQVRISSKVNLLDLHYVIQHAFGWTDSHLFIFRIASMEFVNPIDWEDDAYKFQSATLATLEDLIPKMIPIGGMFSYVYDLGDSWEHEILVEGIDYKGSSFSDAICLAGQGACPPEDVGGLPGYTQLLEYLQYPGTEGYQNTVDWLGYVYDPQSFDSVDDINQSIRDYFKTTQLQDDSPWAKSLPLHKPSFDFVSGWVNHLSPEDRRYAESLAFRQDVVSLLNYLRDNKVRGTKATGNFPRKDIRAIAALFVEPISLDRRFADQVYELRTEDEVPDLIFIHHFVNAAGLILGGENMLWELTSLGEKFLANPPEAQAWYLTKYWFYEFNWEFSYPFFDAEIGEDYFRFQRHLIKLLTSYPTGKQIEIKKVIQDLDHAYPGWIHVEKSRDYAASTKYRFFIDVVVKQFGKFGVFEVIKTRDEEIDFDFYFYYTHITMTEYGKTLLMYLR